MDFLMVVLLVAVVGGAVGATLSRFGAKSSERADSQQIKAKRIELVDGQGRTKMLLTTEDSALLLGSPRLRLFDDFGEAKVEVGVVGIHPFINLLGKTGADSQIRVVLAADNNGAAGLTLYDQFGTERAYLTADDSAVNLQLSDKKGRPRVKVREDDAANASLELGDAEGHLRAAVAASDRGAALECFNKAGKLQVSLSATNGGSTLDLKDDREISRATLYAGGGGIDLDFLTSALLKPAAGDEHKQERVDQAVELFRDRSGLSLADARGHPRVEIGVDTFGESEAEHGQASRAFATLFDEHGHETWRRQAR